MNKKRICFSLTITLVSIMMCAGLASAITVWPPVYVYEIGTGFVQNENSVVSQDGNCARIYGTAGNGGTLLCQLASTADSDSCQVHVYARSDSSPYSIIWVSIAEDSDGPWYSLGNCVVFTTGQWLYFGIPDGYPDFNWITVSGYYSSMTTDVYIDCIETGY